MTDSWLIDKSAAIRLVASPDIDIWANRTARGLVSISTVTLLELGFSARSGEDLATSHSQPPLVLMPTDWLTPAAEKRAVEVQLLLARRGHHRAPSIPDFLVAACAEVHGRIVLHVDKDFELIAEITGQPTERLRLA
ncbi:PIN domain nuclease [Ammonicoccus fulvus]|uniref:Ribonuclease VapC n=1 Tax=Ammonicoccus fulvus TaxID=3138240 RepID=A0ABZ3FQE7_9ACTN